jgi:hypothetical protein
MASQRGSAILWKATDAASAAGGSAIASIGSLQNVAVSIQNIAGGALTFKVQAAFPGARSAGKNEFTGAADGGATWCDVMKADGTGPLVLTSPTNTNIVYNLSPYAPESVRLVSVEGFTAGKVVASVAYSGSD